MASYETVKRELEYFLDQVDWEDGRVMAIYGEWGVGKTHICRQFLLPSSKQKETTWCRKISDFFRLLWPILKSFRINNAQICKTILDLPRKICNFTFFRSSIHEDNDTRNNDRVYVSLFGLETIDEVKRSLCFGGSDLTNIRKLVSVKLPLWKEVSVSADVLTTIVFSKIHKKTIFIDDLERLKDDKNLSRDLLGLISTLKEKHK